MLRNREDGGKLLAQVLGPLRVEEPIVLGLARGGVPVAVEVARALDAPLHVLTVQKLGAPGCPEYTIGAVVEDGAVYLRRGALHEVGMTEAEGAELAERASVGLLHRVRLYRGEQALPSLAGRSVILIDDGVATGSTGCAAARAVRRGGAARVLLAAPVAAMTAEPELGRELDALVAVERPRPFVALPIWYQEFDPVSDKEVVQCIRPGEEHPLTQGEHLPGRAREPSASLAANVLAIRSEGAPPLVLESDLVLPAGATGIVVFSTGSTRESPRYRLISRALHHAGVATLRCDLLSPTERHDGLTQLPANSKDLTERITTVIRWIATYPATRGLHRGLYVAGAGTEAVLEAVAADPDLVEAIVVRAGQLDTVSTLTLASVRAPLLLVVGSRDETVLSANRAALAHFETADLAVVPGATDLFGEPGALEAVGRLATDWFTRWLVGRATNPSTPPARRW